MLAMKKNLDVLRDALLDGEVDLQNVVDFSLPPVMHTLMMNLALRHSLNAHIGDGVSQYPVSTAWPA